MDAFITMYSMELLRQQEITDTNMHMEAVMVTEVNTVMETMDMAMVTVTAMDMDTATTPRNSSDVWHILKEKVNTRKRPA